MDRKTITYSFIRIAVTLCIAVSSAMTVSAQEYISTPVSISKEKVRVNGKICYSHIVREKQTLYSIAKAYEVTVDDIYSFNPSLKETGLKKNSIILIPSKDALSAKTAPASEKTSPEQEVTKKEPDKKEKAVTAEQPVKDRVKNEPEKPAEAKKTETKKAETKKRKTHTVKWYEDLDVIADKYGVTVEALMKANGLTGRKLSKRQKLVIPEPGELTDVTEEIPEEEMKKPEVPAEGSTEAAEESPEIRDTSEVRKKEQTLEPDWLFSPKDEVKVTLILPLKASGDNVSRNNMDFYSGVLLAVKDLAETGTSTILNVYDSSEESHPIASEDLTESDLIIGPVSSGDLRRLLEDEAKPKTVISPLDPRAESLAYSHPNLIHAPTPHMVQYTDLTEWMKEDTMPGDVLLMISEKGARQTENIAQMTQVADSSGLKFIPFSYSILEGRDITAPLTQLMTPTGTNRVLIASESEAFVNDVIRNLNILIHRKMNIVLYAPAKVRNFETIEVENLHNTSLHVSLGYLIDYDNQDVKDFLLKYRALFNTEPSQFAFQGYDIAKYFIGMYSQYGPRWTRKLDDSERQMLQSTFRFIPVDDGGFINHGVRRIIYGQNWSMEKMNQED